jgi:hypothetical protein
MNHEFYDKHFATGISKLTACNVVRLTSIRRPDVTQFALNAILKRAVPDREKAFLFNFVRRASNALLDYDQAAMEFAAFIDGEKSDFREYLAAVHHFEGVLAELTACHSLLFRIRGGKYFNKNDGSPLSRLSLMNNEIKHADGSIENGDFQVSSTLPLWLTNQGLKSYQSELTWNELAAIIRDVAEAANNAARLD